MCSQPYALSVVAIVAVVAVVAVELRPHVTEPESPTPIKPPPPSRDPRTRGRSSARLLRLIASSSRPIEGLEAQKPTVLDLSNSEQEDPSEEFSAYTDRPTGTLKRVPPELATPKRLEHPKAKLSRVLEPT